MNKRVCAQNYSFIHLERLLQEFRRTGMVQYKQAFRQNSIVGNDDNELLVLLLLGYIIEDPQTSPKIERETGMSRRSIYRIIQNKEDTVASRTL